MSQPEQVATAATEKLLVYAMGRGLEHFDAPAVRRIVRDAAASGYKIQSLILGVAKSAPFQMRKGPAEPRESAPAAAAVAERR
jgi:hypothetical protein